MHMFSINFPCLFVVLNSIGHQTTVLRFPGPVLHRLGELWWETQRCWGTPLWSLDQGVDFGDISIDSMVV